MPLLMFMPVETQKSITIQGLNRFSNFVFHAPDNYNYYASVGKQLVPLTYMQAGILIYLGKVDMSKDPTKGRIAKNLEGLEQLLEVSIDELGFPFIELQGELPALTEQAKTATYLAIPKNK